MRGRGGGHWTVLVTLAPQSHSTAADPWYGPGCEELLGYLGLCKENNRFVKDCLKL